ncbi:MAG: 30S ribosomal protein S8 [Conexivisphaerales archaeon]
MPANDVLSNLFSTIMENEKRNTKECIIMPASTLLQETLKVMQKNGYIGEFELIDDRIMPKLKVQLLGRINKCGSIKPRYSTKWQLISQWERRYLPAVGMGIILLSTDKGVMSHNDAMNQKLGGRLLGYVY